MAKTKNKDGLYRTQVYLGRGDDGRRKYKCFYGKTQKEANNKAQDLKVKLNKGLDVSCDNDTFEEWANRWLSNKSTLVSKSRYNTCKTHLKKLESVFNLPITKMKTADIQEVINDLYKCNPTTGRPASKDLLKCVKNTASQIFQLAIDNRIMEYNPALAVKIPSNSEKQGRLGITDEQIGWIEETPHRAQLPAMIMLYAGLRRGEVMALTWNDINLDNKTIVVNKSIEMIHGQPQIKKGGKTDAATRTIYIPQILCDFLASQKKTTFLVCPNTQNRIMSSSSWRKMWESYMCDLNVKYGDFTFTDIPNKENLNKFSPHSLPLTIDIFTAHQLRHTYATMLYKSGIDILTAKNQLGHSDIKTTLEIYTHLDDLYKKNSMGKLNDFINGKENKASI